MIYINDNLKVDVARMEESIKIIYKRLDSIEKNQGEIKDLAISTKLLAQTVAMQQKDIDKINQNLQTINHKPMKWIDLIKSTLISAFFGAIAVAIISLIIRQ